MKYQRLNKYSTLISVLAVILACLAAFLGPYLLVNPRDRIRVNISRLPPDAIYVSLVSEANGTLQNMKFYPRSELYIPFTMHPSGCTLCDARFRDPSKTIEWSVPVEWRWGERYGLVTMDRGGTWRVTWFAANDVPFKGHWLILGNGEAYFDMSKGNTTILLEEQRKELRLEYAL